MGSCLLIILFITLISIIYTTLKVGISPHPSSQKATKKILSLLSNNPAKTIFDLGSGWGTLAFPLAKHFPDAQITALELSPVPYLFSLLRKLLFPRPNLHIVRKNFFHHSLESADVVVCYLCPKAMTKLEIKLRKELPKNALVITNTFSLPHITPDQTAQENDLFRSRIYLYTF